ncbi:MAG: hypothetical protein QM804_00250 [Propionicimonas sp.]
MPEPVRYRLTRQLPLAWRGSGVLQLGLDEGLVLQGVPDELPQAIWALAEPRSLTELERLTPALGEPWLSWLLARLTTAGLVTTEPELPAAIGLLGAGRLADTLAAALAKAGPIDLTRAAHTRPRGRRRLTGPLPHWSEAVAGLPPVVVVATDTQEPDRAVTDALARTGRTHLVVRLEADRAVVGPLVLPGRTPCVRCHDLLRCHYDRAWPLLVAQLCHDRPAPDPVLLGWAVSTAVVQLRCLLAGGEPDATGRTLELGSADHVLRVRDWQVHPGCGCVLAAA